MERTEENNAGRSRMRYPSLTCHSKGRCAVSMDRKQLEQAVTGKGGVVRCGQILWWDETERREWRLKQPKTGKGQWLGYRIGSGGIDGSDLIRMDVDDFAKAFLKQPKA